MKFSQPVLMIHWKKRCYNEICKNNEISKYLSLEIFGILLANTMISSKKNVLIESQKFLVT